jgi:ketosteroid isomerase-like protein
MGKVAFADVEITPIGAENALVRGRWKVVTSKETMEGLFTLRFQKLDAGWRIVHDHSSAAEPPKKKE